MTDLTGMTQERWSSMSITQREAARSNAGLTEQLIGLEGWRVEVVTDYDEKRRFIVGKSTGWIPCHLEISRVSASGGDPAEKHYKSVTRLSKVR